MAQFHQSLGVSGTLKNLREGQLGRWFWNEVQAVLAEEISQHPRLASQAGDLEAATRSGEALPPAAARQLVQRFRSS
jgi:putative protein kinase ArgK-like GTPase of G3E family